MEDKVETHTKGNWVPGVGLGVVSVGLFVLCAPFLTIPASRKLGSLPWMTTPQHVIDRLFRVPAVRQQQQLQGGKGSSFVDLGSGDGRLVIEAAKQGFSRCVGFELNPLLIALSYVNAARAGVLGRVSFTRRDFWNANLDSATVISCFGVNSIMGRLADKMQKRSIDGHAPLLICLFRFPLPAEHAKRIVHRDDKNELFVYRM